MIRKLLIVLLCVGSAAGQGYVCAEGGGNAGKGSWADEVFGWMVEKGGRGKVVVIGAVPIEGEDSRVALFKRLGAPDVTPMVVTQENADKQETYDTIAAASVVFIRGGSQSRYVEWWKGTKTQAAIEAVFKKGGVIAGTSAGCAVLGEVDYDAKTGSLSAREALADGRHENLTLTTGFLDFVPGVLFDTHFTERGRLARLPVMLAHCKEDLKKPDILGIGVDPRTAVCVGPDGVAEIKGEGTATFLRLTPESKIAIEKGKPPTVSHLDYLQLCAGYTYNLKTRSEVSRPDSRTRSRSVAMQRSTASDRPIIIDGSRAEDAEIGREHLVPQPDDAWLAGHPAMKPGTDKLHYATIATRVFSERATANSFAGLQRVVSDWPVVAIWLDQTAQVRAAGWYITVIATAVEPRSVLFLDGLDMVGRASGPPPRRAVAIEHATLHLIAPGWRVRPENGEVSAPNP